MSVVTCIIGTRCQFRDSAQINLDHGRYVDLMVNVIMVVAGDMVVC